ncbi:MAG: hypothetical protein GY865_11750 [candidate division Zixibacteria bacterium]|nr:hypothetical protein [candidate division Zixibacteria bacterium]
MANEKCKVKNGMGGSRNGKNRYAGTAILKKQSKKKRRAIAKANITSCSSSNPFGLDLGL